MPRIAQPYVTEISDQLKEDVFPKFLESDKFTRYCQWKVNRQGEGGKTKTDEEQFKNLELNMQLTMNDFSGISKNKKKEKMCQFHQSPPDNWAWGVRRSVRMQKGGHGQNVRDEMSGQEEDQAQAGWEGPGSEQK